MIESGECYYEKWCISLFIRNGDDPLPKVDVGLVEHYKRQKAVGSWFCLATKGEKKYYIESTFAMNNEDKVRRNERVLLLWVFAKMFSESILRPTPVHGAVHR